MGIDEGDVNNAGAGSSKLQLSNSTIIYIIVSVILLLTAFVIILTTRNRRRAIDREVERVLAGKKDNGSEGRHQSPADFDDLVAKFVGLRRHPNAGQVGSPDPRGIGAYENDAVAPEFDWDEVSQHVQSREAGDGKDDPDELDYRSGRRKGGSDGGQRRPAASHSRSNINADNYERGFLIRDDSSAASGFSETTPSHIPKWFDEMKNRHEAEISSDAKKTGSPVIKSRDFEMAALNYPSNGALEFEDDDDGPMFRRPPADAVEEEYDSEDDVIPYVYSKQNGSNFPSGGFVDEEYIREDDLPYMYPGGMQAADGAHAAYLSGEYIHSPEGFAEGFDFDDVDAAAAELELDEDRKAGKRLESKLSMSTVEYDSNSSLNMPLTAAIFSPPRSHRDLIAGGKSVRRPPDLVPDISALNEATVTEDRNSTLSKSSASHVYERMDDLQFTYDGDGALQADAASAEPLARFSHGPMRSASIKFEVEVKSDNGLRHRAESADSFTSDVSSHVV